MFFLVIRGNLRHRAYCPEWEIPQVCPIRVNCDSATHLTPSDKKACSAGGKVCPVKSLRLFIREYREYREYKEYRDYRDYREYREYREPILNNR